MGSSAAYRHCLILMLASTYCLLAHPAPFTWTGAVNNDWGQAANWSPAGPPGLSDSAVIPATPTGGRFPTLQPGESFCSGLILEANAEIVVASGAGLYVIGEGDMDGDGLADVAEIILGSMDVDLDGDPNLNDPDSDGDGMDDGWEDLYGFDPYAVGDPGDPGHPHADPDGDGRDNLKEFQDGTDPWTYDCAMPAAAAWALLVTAGAVLGLAGIGMRKRGRWASASALLVFGLVTGGTVFADDTPAAGSPKANVSVDFAAGDSIPAAAATANAGDRLLLSGSFVRPWNGRSTYATKALTLKAVGGPVFLGGMRTDLAVGVSGEGTVEVTSAYTATLHPAPVDNVVDYGTQPVFCFLGERLQLAPTPAEDWAFFAWTGDVQGNTDPLTMQVAEDGLAVTSVFAPPEGDLYADWLSPPPDSGQAGDTLSATFSVTNIGQATTAGASWSDGIYLSRDTAWDGADLELDLQAHVGALPSEGSYSVVVSEAFPDLAPGVYYVLGVTNVSAAAESSEENNAVSKRVAVLDTVLAR